MLRMRRRGYNVCSRRHMLSAASHFLPLSRGEWESFDSARSSFGMEIIIASSSIIKALELIIDFVPPELPSRSNVQVLFLKLVMVVIC